MEENITEGVMEKGGVTGDNISTGLQAGLASFLCLALFVGVVGNIMTIYVIISRKKLRTNSNVYVANLAVADILLLAVNLPTTIMEFYYGDNHIMYREYCRYTSPINIMTMICALNSVAAVGFNRFLLLCMNKAVYRKFTRKSSIILSLVIIWMWSFCIVLPPMVGYGEFGYHTKFRTCFFKAYDQQSWMYGTIFCCILGVFPPVMASTFFYGKILLKLSENRRNLMRHYLPPISKLTTNANQLKAVKSSDELLRKDGNSFKEIAISDNSSQSQASPLPKRKKKKVKSSALLLRQNNHQRRSTMMLVTVFIVIVICWLPISLSFMADRNNELPSIVYVCFVILAWLNSCVNIFIYAGMNLQYRRAYVSLLIKPFKRVKNTTVVTSGSGTIGTAPAMDSVTDSKTMD